MPGVLMGKNHAGLNSRVRVKNRRTAITEASCLMFILVWYSLDKFV